MNAYPNRTRSTLLLLAGLLFAFLPMGWGNNVTVTNVQLGARNAQTETAPISFNLRWENSWNATYSKDAVWVFVKYRKAGTPTWHHAYLSTSGVTYANGWTHEAGMDESNQHVLGMFFRNNNIGESMVDSLSTTVTIQWKYAANSERVLTANDNVEIRVYPVEMVYVKGGEGSFKLGDGGASTKSFRSAKDGSPFEMTFAGTAYNVVDTFSGIQHLFTQDTILISKDKVLKLPYNLPAGENRFALISVMTKDKEVSSIKVGTTTLDLNSSLVDLGTQDKSKTYVYKYAPVAGDHGETVEVRLSGDTDHGFFSISTFSGVNQTTPIASSFGQGEKSSTPLQENITWEKADLIFSAVSSEKASISKPSDQDFLSPNRQADEVWAATSIKQPVSNPSEQVSYNLAESKKWGLVTVVMKPQPQDGGYTLTGQNGFSNNINFPTGYNSFYCMKYEVTQAQYVEFLNTLDLVQQGYRTETPPESGDPGDGALNFNNDYLNGIDIKQTGGAFPAIYGCNLSDDGDFDNPENDGAPKACNYLAWDDLAAWLDWAALRPITELEFEKLSRPITKSQMSVAYPWGVNRDPIEFSGSVSNEGSVSEQLTNKEEAFNCNWGNGYYGPLRVGFFARDSGTKRNREYAGASLTGVMDLAGNLWEMVVTIETEDGRGFTGNHGDGSTQTSPPWSLTSESGIGCRGGSWESTDNQDIRVSNRSHVANGPIGRQPQYGGRGARTSAN